MEDTLQVPLGERSYPIHFAADVVDRVRQCIEEAASGGKKVVVITDRNFVAAQSAAISTMCASAAVVHKVAPGEHSKCLQEYGAILDVMAEHRVDRSGIVLALGGGVIGDLAGFAAASYLRGIELHQVPTTLLSMVDSSVGGKTGINLAAGKNLVGAFHQPKAVYIGTQFLQTLPPREFAAGMAEVIKYGLLGDRALFEKLEKSPLTVNSGELTEVIRRCCAIKAEIVAADERELAKEGGRALLNLGHTFGHAVEQVTGYGVYLHGEAVAIGLAAAARLSVALGFVTAADVARIENVLSQHVLPTRLKGALAVDGLMAAMGRDKKVRAGMPRFVVLDAIGKASTRSGISEELVVKVWREVGAS